MYNIMFDSQFNSFPAEARFNIPQMDNTKHNIIAGPKSHQYWWHSPGIKQPMEREEQGFPIQGNIGSLVKQEALDNWSKCLQPNNESISGSPNCTNTFDPDFYTTRDTCGAACVMKAPESFGDKDFGLLPGAKETNIHGLHAYENIRAGSAGQGPSNAYGCFEWIPGQGQYGNKCILDYPAAYQTVGDWSKLPEFTNLVVPNPMPQHPADSPVS